MFSKIVTAGIVALIATPATAFIRFGCANNLVEERADPIVHPGSVADHAHKIVGGNGFGFDMSYDKARASQCSSCPIKQDFSNYWTPKLYFQHADGTFQSVPTVGDNMNDLNGGQTVYYLQRSPGPLKAFPKDFRMLAGDMNKRNFTNDYAGQAVSFACLGANKDETNFLPGYNCPGGLRAQIFFPSCWDGVNTDSANHKSHMSYPATGAYNNPTTCPTTHPVQLISLFFEVLYDTNQFADKWGTSKQPFVFANGDNTGYGFHGDFVNGWDIPTLQSIVDDCKDLSGTLDACPIIQQFTLAEQNACRLTPQVDEQVRGNLAALPGCNPVSSGPDAAPASPVCMGQKAAVIGSAIVPFTDVSTSKGWGYMGCGTDNNNPRTLADKQSVYLSGAGENMTVEWCMDFCDGYKYAGLEYASQCFCANTLPTAGAPQTGILGNCNMACTGNAKELCGGPSALAIYTKCASGSTCSNAGASSSSASSSNATPASSTATSSSSSSTPTTSLPTTTTPSKAPTTSSYITPIAKVINPSSNSISTTPATAKGESGMKTVYVIVPAAACTSAL